MEAGLARVEGAESRPKGRPKGRRVENSAAQGAVLNLRGGKGSSMSAGRVTTRRGARAVVVMLPEEMAERMAASQCEG